jgi:TonB family protein
LLFPSYCFSPAKPILRSLTTFSNFNQVLFNRILLFGGRYLGGDIEVTLLGNEYAKVHLELAEPLGLPDRIDFSPPADAVAPPPQKITTSPAVTQGHVLSKPAPAYPQSAKAKRVEGKVVMQATIDESGHITRLQVVSGPLELQGAAIDSVRQWTYEPYLLNGKPVEIETTISVIFRLAG